MAKVSSEKGLFQGHYYLPTYHLDHTKQQNNFSLGDTENAVINQRRAKTAVASRYQNLLRPGNKIVNLPPLENSKSFIYSNLDVAQNGSSSRLSSAQTCTTRDSQDLDAILKNLKQ